MMTEVYRNISFTNKNNNKFINYKETNTIKLRYRPLENRKNYISKNLLLE